MCERNGICKYCKYANAIPIVPTEWKDKQIALYVFTCEWNEVYGKDTNMLSKYPLTNPTQCVDLLLESLEEEYDREEE